MINIVYRGRSNITAKIIADSRHQGTGTRLTTFELEYPRFIHSEFMTHRMLSKNSASSRAIPIKAMHEHIRAVPQEPVEWGKNNPGMQSKELLAPLQRDAVKMTWDAAREAALSHAHVMSDIGIHKQIANRVTEPFMQMKVVVSGTEWNNFFWLRDHEDADPTIHELASLMKETYDNSICWDLAPGEWHLPYITPARDETDEIQYWSDENTVLSLEDARIVSASCCAQVSYRKSDDSLEKAHSIYQRLIGSEPVHASPVEHQATPIDYDSTVQTEPETWEEGVTHMTANGDLWSGNFRDWIQFRKLIPNNTKW